MSKKFGPETMACFPTLQIHNHFQFDEMCLTNNSDYAQRYPVVYELNFKGAEILEIKRFSNL